MTPTAAASLFYQTAGTLKPDAPSYVERAADRELRERLKAGEYCFVLTSRQMGKSSLMQRTARDLKLEGFRVAVVDLTELGTERGSDGWYYSFCETVHEQAGAVWSFSDWWQREAALTPTRRLTKFLGELAEDADRPLVVFVDEIDSTIGLTFKDDFFAAIRACYNARSRDARFERLTFVLLGAATPAQLIRNAARTPFNIGHEITPGDFTPPEAAKLGLLLSTAEPRREELLNQILSWTDGHPYLTQTMCKEIAGRGVETTVNAVADELYLRPGKLHSDVHLKQAADRLVQGGRPLMRLYQRVRSGREVFYEPASPLHAQALLTGTLKSDERGRLRVRNRIYETVLGEEWIQESMPKSRSGWLAVVAGVIATIAMTSSVWTLKLQRDTEALLWDERAQRAMVEGKRDYALLAWLQAAAKERSDLRLRQAATLAGNERGRVLGSLAAKEDSLAAIGPDNNVVFGEGGRLLQANILTGKAGDISIRPSGVVEALAYSPDGSTILTAGGMLIERWDTVQGRPLGPPIHSESCGLSVIASRPDNRVLATGCNDETGQLWDVKTNKEIERFGSDSSLLAFAFDMSGKSFLAGWSGLLVELSAGAKARTVDVPDDPTHVAFRHDGALFLVATKDFVFVFRDARPIKLEAVRALPKDSIKAVRFGGDCDVCLEILAYRPGSGLYLSRLRWDSADAEPLRGNPQQLLDQWEGSLGLKISPQGEIEPEIR